MRRFHAIICLIILVAAVCPAFAAETTSAEAQQPAAQPKPKASTITKPTSSTAKSAASTAKLSSSATKSATTTTKAAAKTTVKATKPAIVRTLDTQLSGFTSQDADSVYARLSIDEKRDGRTWYAKGSINTTATNANRTSHVLTYRLDSRLEQMRNKSGEYNIYTGVMSARDRGSSPQNIKKSGYQYLSFGTGKVFNPQTKGDIGVGLLNVRDEDTGVQPAVIASIRGRRPLSKKLTLDADILTIQPMDELSSTKLDSDVGLAYELAPGFFLRLDWQATNLIRSAYTYKEWDSVVRLSISLRRTSTSD